MKSLGNEINHWKRKKSTEDKRNPWKMDKLHGRGMKWRAEEKTGNQNLYLKHTNLHPIPINKYITFAKE
jgi:hypothetical protein